MKASERQADYVEVAAFDAGDEAAGAALDGVAASLVVGFASGQITGDVIGGKRGKVHQSGFDESDALCVRKSDEGDSSDNGVRKARESFEHVTGVLGGARLAKYVPFEGDLSVSADDDGGPDGARSDKLGFGEGQTLDEFVGRFTGVRGFVNSGGKYAKREAGVVKDFGAADGSGGEDELQGNSRRENTTARGR